MSDPRPDPPKTLEAAEERFREFLAAQGYPDTIHWLMRGNVLVDGHGRFWVRECGAKALDQVKLRYSEGVERNLGVALYALCTTDTETLASMFVPADDLDRQYHLMGHGLKLSCPTTRVSASTVKNPLKWWILELRNKRRSKMLEL
jgi:hypothetical protein